VRRSTARAAARESGIDARMSAPSRDQLLQWIAQTRRNQRRLLAVVVACAAVSALLFAWRKEVGVVGVIATLSLAIAGFWITSSHIADWKQRLELLERRRS
jgi:hypothetical protein